MIEGETIELKDVYVGFKKEFKSRLIVTKLIEKIKIRERLHIKKILEKNAKYLSKIIIGFFSWNYRLI